MRKTGIKKVQFNKAHMQFIKTHVKFRTTHARNAPTAPTRAKIERMHVLKQTIKHKTKHIPLTSRTQY